MVDLTEFAGEVALRTSLQKKRDAAKEKLDAAIAKAQLKIAPLQAKLEKLDALLQVLEGGAAGVFDKAEAENPENNEV